MPERGIKGPITVVSGKRRRVTIMEVGSSMPEMIDASKVCDLAILAIDCTKGLEMEQFEFLNMLQVHGMPRVMGALTFMDKFSDAKALKKRRKALKRRFETEVGPGAKLFHFAGFKHESYPKRDVLNLARFISIAKAKPLSWRVNHPYVLADRLEDISDPAEKQNNPGIDRRVVLYGYLRGCALRSATTVHICGVGDASVESVTEQDDPCPSPAAAEENRKLGNRTLRDKERLVHAPMTDLGGIERDDDAMYVHMDERRMIFTDNSQTGGNLSSQAGTAVRGGLGVGMVKQLQSIDQPIDTKLGDRSISLVQGGAELKQPQEEAEAEGRGGDGEPDDAGNSTESEDEHDAERTNDDDEDALEREKKAAGRQGESNQDSDDEGSEDDQSGQVAERSLQDMVYGGFEAGIDDEGMDGGFPLSAHRKGKVDDEEEGDDEDDGNIFKKASIGEKEFDCSRPRISDEELDEAAEDIEALMRLFVNDTTDDQLDAEDGSKQDAEDNEKENDDRIEREDGEEDDRNDQQRASVSRGKHHHQNGKDAQDASKERTVQATKGSMTRIQDLEAWGDAVKREQEARRQATRRRLDSLPEKQRMELEGARPGAYVRVELDRVSAETVDRFDPRWPLIAGGVNPGEEGSTIHLAKTKRHRWYPKILKNRDPLVVSSGWRRFQTVPVLCVEDDNLRLRSVKYTPEHAHCLMAFLAPRTPPNTPLASFQSLKMNVMNFRVAATGTVEAQDPAARIVKKLKLVGEPRKIFKRTASISGMFNSDVEASKFEGAKVRTVSDIRGTVKKPIASDGSVRCTFEDRLTKSDLVFLRAWVTVPVPRFTVTAANLLQHDKRSWQLMRTVAELRREKNEPVSVNTNSLYQPIERWKRKFTPMKVPNSLQARLPYKSKPKNDQAANPNRLEAKRKRGVVRSSEERKRKALLHTLSTVTKHQQRKEAEQKNRKRKEREKEEAKAKAAKDKAQKARKKEYFKQEQLKQQKNAKRKGGEENNRTAVASS